MWLVHQALVTCYHDLTNGKDLHPAQYSLPSGLAVVSQCMDALDVCIVRHLDITRYVQQKDLQILYHTLITLLS